MAYAFKKSEKIVVFFAAAAFLSIIVILVLFVSQKNMFRSGSTYYADFKTARGVKVGSPITLLEVPIGSVKNIKLTENNMVMVSIFIYREYTDRIKTDSVLVSRSQILGSTELMVYPGSKDAAMLSNKSVIQSSDTTLGNTYRRRYETQMGGNASIDLAIANANTIMGTLNDPDVGLYPALSQINSILSELNTSMDKGALGYILKNEDVRETLSRSLGNLEGTLSNTYSITVEVKKLSQMLGRKTPEIERIIDNSVLITDELAITTRQINIMMPSMKTLLSNTAIITSNLAPITKDISKLRKTLR